jgi:peptide/nickel transport system substrate-binding protein
VLTAVFGDFAMFIFSKTIAPIVVAFSLSAGLSSGAYAQNKTFRWASSGELPSWDPHSQNNALSNGIHAYVYESLVYYDKKFNIEASLATKWESKSPTQMRFHLRKGVKFHDGSPFTADDVVFSMVEFKIKLRTLAFLPKVLTKL